MNLERYKKYGLLSTKDITVDWIENLFKTVKELKSNNFKLSFLDKKIALVFYENSTRTKSSFMLAADKINANIIDLNIQASSVNKGENIFDTLQTLISLGVNIIVFRHACSFACEKFAIKINQKNPEVKFINAGDGINEHPTQALLDLFTMAENLEASLDIFKDKKILIVGDCLHSRVARSSIFLLQKFGCDVSLVGPPGLVPKYFETFGVKVFHNLTEALNKHPHFINVLRIQKERLEEQYLSSLSEYIKYYGINSKNLSKSNINLDKVKILSPGPVIRDLEISSDIVDNENVSLINQQVTNGLYIRTAILAEMLHIN